MRVEGPPRAPVSSPSLSYDYEEPERTVEGSGSPPVLSSSSVLSLRDSFLEQHLVPHSRGLPKRVDEGQSHTFLRTTRLLAPLNRVGALPPTGWPECDRRV